MTAIQLGAMCACITLGSLLTTGCASTYGNLVSGSNLGAQEYRPAVYVPPGKEGQYEQILSICRQAAINRQITAVQQAQLETITGSVQGAAQGAAAGMEIGAIFKGFDSDVSINQTAGVGLAAGLIGGLADSFASGTEDTAAKTRQALLVCLRAQADAVGYTVLE